jgi:dTMP kinase
MYVALEGIDRAGKSTQIELLQNAFPDAIFTKEPGGTSLGRDIRTILLHTQHPSPLAELFLFLADRNQHINEVIKPNLQKLIISDRSFLSGIAYAKMKTNLSDEELFSLNELALEGILPDRVILLELSEEELRKRFASSALDRIEKEGVEYLLEVQKNLKNALFKSGIEYIIIDAAKPKEHIFETIKRFLKEADGN